MDAPLRLPSSFEDANLEYIQKGTDGSIQLLVSPKNAGTWRLNVAVLTIPSGRELPPRRAAAVEFYYVLSGTGLVSQQGLMETYEFKPGDCFIVDPGSMRWISNKPGIEDLVLMRTTDGGSKYCQRTFELIRKDPNRRPSVMESLRESFHQLQILARDYVGGGADSNGDGE